MTCHSAEHPAGLPPCRAAARHRPRSRNSRAFEKARPDIGPPSIAKTRRPRETTPSPWRGVSIEGSLRQRPVFGLQDLRPLGFRAVAFGQLLAAYGDDAAADDRGLEAAAWNLDGPQPLPAARIGVEALDDVEIKSAGPPGDHV